MDYKAIMSVVALVAALGAVGYTYYQTKKQVDPRLVSEDSLPEHLAPTPPSGKSGMKTLDTKPPATEKAYETEYGEKPPRLIHVPNEKRFYSYANGTRMYWSPKTQLWISGSPD